jgi:UPF0271 protein
MCKSQDVELQHVKPHGVLYNMTAKNYELSREICESVKEFDDRIIYIGIIR